MHEKPRQQVEKIGTVHVPVSQWKLGQTLLWLQRRGYEGDEECPMDASILPEKYGLSSKLLPDEGEVFHTFREVRFEEAVAGDLPEIVFVFDRMRITSPEVKEEVDLMTSLGLKKVSLAKEAQAVLASQHGIVINLKFLEDSLRTGSVYAEVSSATELVERVLQNVRQPEITKES